MLTVGCFLFDAMTALDVVGPYETLAGLPGVEVVLIAARTAPVRAEGGMRMVPDYNLATAPSLDVLLMPGGSGINPIMEDHHWLDFIRQRASTARWITSVCTGSLVLGAAGLLRGYRATTHWLSLDLLPLLGAIPSADRVVLDRNRLTAGGVTAGIDMGLLLAAKLTGENTARQRQLLLQYDPQPPFRDGAPATADPQIVHAVTSARQALQQTRREIISRLPHNPDS